MIWRLPDTYHSAGHGRGTATLKFYEGRDILGSLILLVGPGKLSLDALLFGRDRIGAGGSSDPVRG